MSYRVEVSPDVDRDLERLADFLTDDSPNSAITGRDLITNAILSLADYPKRGFAGRKRGFRQLVVRFGNSGYVIRYRIGRDIVFVTRVFHGRERR